LKNNLLIRIYLIYFSNHENLQMSFREALFHCGLTKELVVDVLGKPCRIKKYIFREKLS